jgi:hypothetical protein
LIDAGSPLEAHMYKLSVAALVAAAATPALADISFYGLHPSRWGRTGASVGILGMTVEDFEDVKLASGLQIRWTAPAGDFGPTSTLPNTFNPTTDDPFGTAFADGAWSGSRVLVNTRTNRPFPYSESQNWGNVELLFDPPVRTVAFSVQQMDADNFVFVNNVSFGGISGLTGLTINGSRAGYVVINASGADSISSVRIANTGGDGFVLDHLAFTSTPLPRLALNVVPAANWGAPDASLGFASAIVEDFEDVKLVPSLSIACESPLGDLAPTSTLPNTFDPVTDDPFGSAFAQGVWSGSHALVNTRDNRSHPYAEVGNWGDVSFHFSPSVTHVGFSMGDTNIRALVTLNGRLITSLNLPFGFRQGFLRFTAPTGIESLGVLNGRNPFGDGLVFDHLAFMNCRVDLNSDAVVNSADFFDFLTFFFAGDTRADFNLDATINSQDFFDFLSAFFIGC